MKQTIIDKANDQNNDDLSFIFMFQADVFFDIALVYSYKEDEPSYDILVKVGIDYLGHGRENWLMRCHLPTYSNCQSILPVFRSWNSINQTSSHLRCAGEMVKYSFVR